MRRRAQVLLGITLILVLGAYIADVPVVSSQGLFIRSFYFPGELPFEPKAPEWEKATPMVLPLSGQVVTRPTLPDPTIKSLTVRSLHNGKEMVFLLEWSDPTKNDRLTPGAAEGQRSGAKSEGI